MLNNECWMLKLLLILLFLLNHIRNVRKYKVLWNLKCYWTWKVEQRILNVEIEIVIEVQPALRIAAASFLKGDWGTRGPLLKR